MLKPILIAVCGGSGSGKTTFSKRLKELLPENSCSVIYQDNYYIDQSAKFDHDGGAVNFDHPDSIDFELMGKHLDSLKHGNPIEIPTYDFATHKRVEPSTNLNPTRFIIIDGILILTKEIIVQKFDYKIFIDCPEDLRFSRRLKRDVTERGRTEDGVRSQLAKQVKPMHDQFVEPSRKHANDIIRMENFEDKCLQLSKRILEIS